MLCISKPAGWCVDAGRPDDPREALANVAQAVQDVYHTEPYPIHRLDVGTSGVLTVGMNPGSTAAISGAFRARTTDKVYWALARGGATSIGQQEVQAGATCAALGPDELARLAGTLPAAVQAWEEQYVTSLTAAHAGHVLAPAPGVHVTGAIGAGASVSHMALRPDGRAASTAIVCLGTMATPPAWLTDQGTSSDTPAITSILRVHLYTGRRHQIRVHCAAVGLPLEGDHAYNPAPTAPRMMLHAGYLRVRWVEARTKALRRALQKAAWQRCKEAAGIPSTENVKHYILKQLATVKPSAETVAVDPGSSGVAAAAAPTSSSTPGEQAAVGEKRARDSDAAAGAAGAAAAGASSTSLSLGCELLRWHDAACSGLGCACAAVPKLDPVPPSQLSGDGKYPVLDALAWDKRGIHVLGTAKTTPGDLSDSEVVQILGLPRSDTVWTWAPARFESGASAAELAQAE